MTRVSHDAVVPPQRGSELALDIHTLASEESLTIADTLHDTLLFSVSGAAQIALDGAHHRLPQRAAALVPAAAIAEVVGEQEGVHLLHATIGAAVDHHAPIGDRQVVVAVDEVEPGTATGKRSFQVLFGPHNGSTRATLFVGYIPPGRAPWHYHLYDEIVWVPDGPGRLHLEPGVEELVGGSAFRLHPREVHIVENAGDDDMTVLGLFTPAGSPSAAYLPADSAAATYA